MRSYSTRLPWPFASNQLSELVAAKRSANISLADLTVSNPTRVLSDYPHSEIAAAYGAVPNFDYHPEPFGDRRVRSLISADYAEKGMDVPEDQLALTASTSEAYSLLFKLLCDPGDEVLIPVPSYPLFEFLAGLELVRTVPYRLHYAGEWFVDFDSLQHAITPRTRALVVVNPSNPAGCYLKQSEADMLTRIAASHHIALIADEVFFDYPTPGTRIVPPGLSQYDGTLTFVLNGLSKMAGMPQMKLGWMSIHGPAAERDAAHHRLEVILDTFLSVGTPVQLAAERLFALGRGIRKELHERVCTNLATAQSMLLGSPASCLDSEGGWSAILQLPGILSEEEWVRALLDNSVLVQPGYFFDLPFQPCVVVSLITPPEVFVSGIASVRSLVTATCR